MDLGGIEISGMFKVEGVGLPLGKICDPRVEDAMHRRTDISKRLIILAARATTLET